uniref:Adenosine deaminase n=1 Tax=Culex pipiens TaxID=7175 RepID=A0A8D8B7V0_CULPI
MKLILMFAQALIVARSLEAKTVITASDSSEESRPSLETYMQERKHLIEKEQECFLGSKIILNEQETIVNKCLMKLKKRELDLGYKNSFNFIPARHFFEMLDNINDSALFKFIRKLPKGGVLHAHDTALGGTDLIVNATYRENLWQKGSFEDLEGPKFFFSRVSPGEGWQRVSDVRVGMTDVVYDAKIVDLFGLYDADPINTYKSIDKVWQKFQKMFFALEPLVTFEPVWRQYYYDSLLQFYDDNVHYLEFRGVLPNVYNMDGKIFNPEEVVEMYIEETERFKESHPAFLGAKLIYAPIRFCNDTVADTYLETAVNLHLKFPNFVVGFDLVGQEDTGRPLIDFVPKLLDLPASIQFFFHAGETNWYGMNADQNLVDAILLGTKRIGHGYALVKHPHLLKEIKRRQICVEVNPISNQVLKLVQDQRNHPAAVFFSDDYPVVVSSDDPSFWRASPLSHDFFIAFLGIASSRQDLRMLKQLAQNSIEYSAMVEAERKLALKSWQHYWDKAMHALAEEIVQSRSEHGCEL